MIRYPAGFWRFLPDGFDGVFDWEYLKGIWGRTIEPMDFDCVIEKGGEFLLIETKGPKGNLEDGHQRTFRWILEDPKWTVMVVYGKLPDEVEELFVYNRRSLLRHIKPACALDVRKECQKWADLRVSRNVNEGLTIGRQTR